jgi:hypothetical protein
MDFSCATTLRLGFNYVVLTAFLTLKELYLIFFYKRIIIRYL